MLDALRQIEKRGALDMAKRQGQVCGQIFRYAIASGKADTDIVRNDAQPTQAHFAPSTRATRHHPAGSASIA